MTKKSVSNFTLLSLEEKEYYFEDFGCDLILQPPPFTSEQMAVAGVFGTSYTQCQSIATQPGVEPSSITDRLCLKGRMHICSLNLYFEPTDTRYPVFKFPIGQLHNLAPYPSSPFGHIFLHTTRIALLPYHQPHLIITLSLASTASEFVVLCTTAPPQAPFELISRLHTLVSRMAFKYTPRPMQPVQHQPASTKATVASFFSRLLSRSPSTPASPPPTSPPPSASADPVREARQALRVLVRQRQARTRFDVSLLADYAARNLTTDLHAQASRHVEEVYRRTAPALPPRASRFLTSLLQAMDNTDGSLFVHALAPLMPVAGRLVLTDSQLLFQPLHRTAAAQPLLPGYQRAGGAVVVPLQDVWQAYPRRCDLLDVGLELCVRPREQPVDVRARQCACGCVVTPPPPLPTLSLFVVFPAPLVRDLFLQRLRAQAAFAASDAHSLPRLLLAWVRGELSTFRYLCLLNSFAGRSFADLSQYPVLPWVLGTYGDALATHANAAADSAPGVSASPAENSPVPGELGASAIDAAPWDLNKATLRPLSLPMGAVNAQRDMAEAARAAGPGGHGYLSACLKPFLYGSFYSCPGYMVQYLFRHNPALMLRLQSGKFDHADRQFNSVAGSWASACSSHTDVRELIPQFYDADAEIGDDAWLANAGAGARPVVVPGWSKFARAAVQSYFTPAPVRDGPANACADAGAVVSSSSPATCASCRCACHTGSTTIAALAGPAAPALSPHRAFLAVMRAALEGPGSTHVHAWIDLIFGAHQRGKAASDHDNVFHPYCYGDTRGLADTEVPAAERARERYLFGEHCGVSEAERVLAVHVREFGQVPLQLFVGKHPARGSALTLEQARALVAPGLRGDGSSDVGMREGDGEGEDVEMEAEAKHEEPLSPLPLESALAGKPEQAATPPQLLPVSALRVAASEGQATADSEGEEEDELRDPALVEALLRTPSSPNVATHGSAALSLLPTLPTASLAHSAAAATDTDTDDDDLTNAFTRTRRHTTTAAPSVPADHSESPLSPRVAQLSLASHASPQLADSMRDRDAFTLTPYSAADAPRAIASPTPTLSLDLGALVRGATESLSASNTATTAGPRPSVCMSPPASSPPAPAPASARSRWVWSLPYRTCVRTPLPRLALTALAASDQNVFLLSQDGCLRVADPALAIRRQVKLSPLAVSCAALASADRVLAGSRDNSVYVCAGSYGAVLDTVHAHDSSVSAVATDYLNDKHYASTATRALTGGWDCVARLWAVAPAGLTRLSEFPDAYDSVLAVAAADSGLAAGGGSFAPARGLWALQTAAGDVCMWDERVGEAGRVHIDLDLGLCEVAGVGLWGARTVAACQNAVHFIDWRMGRLVSSVAVDTVSSNLLGSEASEQGVVAAVGTRSGMCVVNERGVLQKHDTAAPVVALASNLHAYAHAHRVSSHNVLYAALADEDNPLITLKTAQ